MTFLLETYLNKPRTFRGPLADAVHKRTSIVASYSEHVYHFEEKIAETRSWFHQDLIYDLSKVWESVKPV